MAYFFKLIFALLVLLFSAGAWSFDPYEVWEVSAPSTYPVGRGSTPGNACNAFSPGFVAAKPGGYTPSPGYVGESGGSPSCMFDVDPYGQLFSFPIAKTGPQCPPDSITGGDGSCSCPEGMEQDMDSAGNPICVEPDDLSCESQSFKWNAWSRPEDRMGVINSTTKPKFDEPFLVCMPLAGNPNTGCKHMFTGISAYRMGSEEPWRLEGHSWALGPNDLAEAGGTLMCVPGLDDIPGEPPTREDRKKDCEHGYAGQVNGVDLCIDRAAGEIKGQDTKTNEDAQGNIKETVTDITCKKENCEITRTTRDPGQTTGTTTTTNMTRTAYCAANPESSVCQGSIDETGSTKNQNGRGDAGGKGKGDGDGLNGNGFCKDNPDSIICKQSSFSGSCEASFTCDGDAIQCAIAREQHVRNCKLFDTPSDESALYATEKNKEGSQTESLPGNSTVDLTANINQTDALGGGACVGDKTVSVMGQSITLPFSVLCPYLDMLGNILVAVSLLLAVRIVMRG